MKRNCAVDISQLVPVSAMTGDSEKDTELLKEMAVNAADFLRSQKWCRSVDNQYCGFGIGGVVAVFLCLISPTSENVDDCLWVIVGDLPPAYIVAEDNLTPAAALDAYIQEMMHWVVAAERGETVDTLIPVNAPPTVEYATHLRSRLEFLRSKILPAM